IPARSSRTWARVPPCAAVARATMTPACSTPASSTASRSACLSRKWWYRPAFESWQRSAISRIEAPWNPRSTNSAVAASTIRACVSGCRSVSGSLAGHVALADPERHQREQERRAGHDQRRPARVAQPAREPVPDEEEEQRPEPAQVVHEQLQRPQALVEQLDADDGL